MRSQPRSRHFCRARRLLTLRWAAPPRGTKAPLTREHRRLPQLGHSCLTLVILAALGTAACSTTHDLGRIGDPATMVQLDTLAAQPGTTAAVTPLPGRHLKPRYTVTAATANGLMVSVGGDAPELLTYDRIHSVSHVDRLHGARNGALIGGLASFVLGFVLGGAAAGLPACCSSPPSPVRVGAEVGGVFALVGVAVGGALGALAGYRDHYVLAPTETASAR